MENTLIPKETNYQKWLDDYKIHCQSENVIVGKVYKGYGVIDGCVHQLSCKTAYYDDKKHILLAYETDNNTYLFLSGRMYAYNDIIYCESIKSLERNKSLSVFVCDAIKEARGRIEPIDKSTLVEILKSSVSSKVSYYFNDSFGIIADAYLNGKIWIKKKGV